MRQTIDSLSLNEISLKRDTIDTYLIVINHDMVISSQDTLAAVLHPDCLYTAIVLYHDYHEPSCLRFLCLVRVTSPDSLVVNIVYLCNVYIHSPFVAVCPLNARVSFCVTLPLDSIAFSIFGTLWKTWLIFGVVTCSMIPI